MTLKSAIREAVTAATNILLILCWIPFGPIMNGQEKKPVRLKIGYLRCLVAWLGVFWPRSGDIQMSDLADDYMARFHIAREDVFKAAHAALRVLGAKYEVCNL